MSSPLIVVMRDGLYRVVYHESKRIALLSRDGVRIDGGGFTELLTAERCVRGLMPGSIFPERKLRRRQSKAQERGRR